MAWTVLAAIAMGWGLTWAAPPAPQADSSPIAFIGVSVVPMDEDRVLTGQTVLVRDGRIAEIGPTAVVAVPRGAVRIDGRGKYLLPGLADMHALFTPEASAAIRASLPQKERFLKMLSDAGADLLVGTDTVVPFLVPGFTPIDEMRFFVAAGLTNYQALRAATSAPARFLGIDSEAGTVAVGKRADLLLVNANPLEQIDNLWRQSGVVLNGRWLPRTEVLRLLDTLAATWPKIVSMGGT